MKLLTALRLLRIRAFFGLVDHDRGICFYIWHRVSSEDCCRMTALMSQWPEGTRYERFPVPIRFSKSISEAESAFYSDKPMFDNWSRHYDYGRRRRKLLNWLIQQVKKQTVQSQTRHGGFGFLALTGETTMQVNQEDYEDKLNTINQLNRKLQCITNQRDLLLDCITGMCENPNPENTEAIRVRIAELRKILGQSEML